MRPCRARCTASGPAAAPVAGSSGIPSPGAKTRHFQARALAGKDTEGGAAQGGQAATGPAAAPRPRPAYRARHRRSEDRCRRARPAVCDAATPSAREQARRPLRSVSIRGSGWVIHPNARPFRLVAQANCDDAAASLEADDHSVCLPASSQHEGGSQRRMAGERKLHRRREDADGRIVSAVGSGLEARRRSRRGSSPWPAPASWRRPCHRKMRP